MAAEKAKPGHLARFSCFAFTGMCFLLWIYFQFNYSVNTDTAILTEFARRMLAGGRFGLDYIDTNPPYSIVIYTPGVLISWLTRLPLYYAITVYGFALLGISVFLSDRVLRNFSFLHSGDRMVFILSFAAAAIAIANTHFTQRDHFILLALVPMVLAQFALQENIPLPRWLSWLSMIFGAAFIFVKPHYGLMPTLMIAWRLASRRNLRALMQPDFIVLSLATLAYIALNAAFFREYWTETAPEMIKIYAATMISTTMFPALFKIILLVNVLILAGFAAFRKNSRAKLFMVLALSSLCFLIAYYTQYKGYTYHLLPASILTFSASALVFSGFTRVAHRKFYILPLMAGALLILYPPKTKSPTHAEYKNLPFARLIDTCPEPCNFFISNDYNYMSFETAMYKNAFHATRYSALWSQTPLACAGAGKGDPAFDKFSATVLEDFRRWRPSVVALVRAHEFCADGRNFPSDFVAFFSQNDAFAREWKNYEPAGTMEFNRDEYFGNWKKYNAEMVFDIYRRKETAP